MGKDIAWPSIVDVATDDCGGDALVATTTVPINQIGQERIPMAPTKKAVAWMTCSLVSHRPKCAEHLADAPISRAKASRA
jgi:hypothetical protein